MLSEMLPSASLPSLLLLLLPSHLPRSRWLACELHPSAKCASCRHQKTGMIWTRMLSRLLPLARLLQLPSLLVRLQLLLLLLPPCLPQQCLPQQCLLRRLLQ